MLWSDKQERGRFLAAFTSLCELRKEMFTKERARLYHVALADLSIEQVEHAISNAIRYGKWMPQPSELREAVVGTLEDRAEIEAGKVWEAIARHGGYSPVAFDDPVTSAVVLRGFGGWGALCRGAEGNQTWFRKDFVRRYVSFARQGIEHRGVLAGVPLEKSPYPVALVGDRVRACALAGVSATALGQPADPHQLPE